MTSSEALRRVESDRIIRDDFSEDLSFWLPEMQQFTYEVYAYLNYSVMPSCRKYPCIQKQMEWNQME